MGTTTWAVSLAGINNPDMGSVAYFGADVSANGESGWVPYWIFNQILELEFLCCSTSVTLDGALTLWASTCHQMHRKRALYLSGELCAGNEVSKLVICHSVCFGVILHKCHLSFPLSERDTGIQGSFQSLLPGAVSWKATDCCSAWLLVKVDLEAS